MINVSDVKLMPEFPIESRKTETGATITGMKRIYDIAFAIQDSILQWGPSGVGKSQAVQQWNQQKVEEYNKRIANGEKVKPWNPNVCDVRLSMKEPVDLVGIPVINNGETVWAIPNMWPKDDGQYSGGVIHFDEFNQGQAAVLNAAYQLILERRLNDYKVPDGYLIIASANPPAYNPTVSDISLPLANRFSHFNVKADFEGFKSYMLTRGTTGSATVSAFLQTQARSLFLDTDKIEKITGIKMVDTLFSDVVATPRTWEVMIKLLDLPESEFTLKEKQDYASGRLGLELANLLFEFVKNQDRYQSWEEILKDKKNFRDETDTEQLYITLFNCLAAISTIEDDETCRKQVLNLIEATRNLKRNEFKIIILSSLTQLKRLAGKYKVYCPSIDAKDMIKLAAKAL